MPEKTVQKEPGKKPAPSKKPKPQQEVVVQIPLSELHPFPDHPFQVREDASMQETAESVKEYGVLVPALARPREDGGYELIAGHRRKHACELAGLATMPVIVRDIDRDAATIIMVDSNLQRENICAHAQVYVPLRLFFTLSCKVIKNALGNGLRRSIVEHDSIQTDVHFF